MLDPQETSFLRFILRSPDIGDGWRKVSRQVWTLVERFGRQELIETQASDEGGGRVRLSERGSAVINYI